MKHFFRLLYTEYVGGVFALTSEQMLAINGASNSFFGWGGEDDEFLNRCETCVQWLDLW